MNGAGFPIRRNVVRDGNPGVQNRTGREREIFPSLPVPNGYFPVIIPCDTRIYPVDFTVNLREAERLRTPGGTRINHIHTQLSPLNSADSACTLLLICMSYAVLVHCVRSLSSASTASQHTPLRYYELSD